MVRKLATLLLLALSLSAFARTRSVGSVHPEASLKDGATVSGVVTSRTGNIIAIAEGVITIDATGAKVIVGRHTNATVEDIQPGMVVFAALRDVTTRADGPLLATLITATPASDASMTGVVENVDLVNRRLTLLRQSVSVDDDTSFGGARQGEVDGLEDIQRNQIVQVQADAVNGRLVAREVLVLSPVIPEVRRLRGTVETIAAESWTIRNDEGGATVTVVINGRTKIAGSPKVGDKVEVLYEIDAAHAFIALTILKVEPLPPIPQIVRVHGIVRAIDRTVDGSLWTVSENDGSEQKVRITPRTKVLSSDINVGDRVEVLAIRKDDGTLEALSAVRLRF